MFSSLMNVVVSVDGQDKEDEGEWSQKNWEDLLLKVSSYPFCSNRKQEENGPITVLTNFLF